MKRFLLLIMLMQAAGINAQVLQYDFNNSLNEQRGNGPVLRVLGNAGTYETDLIDSTTSLSSTVYRFEKNSGLQFDNAAANNFLGNAYTIELFFVFDEMFSWKRVVDWKNRTSDGGAYVFNGQLNFYPLVYSSTAPIQAGKYNYYVVTRDTAGNVFVYTDGDEFISFNDANNLAIMDTSNVLNFFQDDLRVQNEASSGAVAKINLYNYAIDSATVKNTFENLDDLLLSIADVTVDDMNVAVYPNPVNEKVTVRVDQFMATKSIEISLVNMFGAVVYQRTHRDENALISISTRDFPSGIYTVNVRSENALVSKRIIVAH